MLLFRYTPQGLTVHSPPEPRGGQRPSRGDWVHGYAVTDGRVESGKTAPRFDSAPTPERDDAPLDYPPSGCRTRVRWNGERLEVLTDHAGVFPLYAACTGDALWIGSDAWEVARGAGLRDPDPESCMDLLCFEYVLGRRTLIRGLEELPCGFRIRWDWKNGRLERSESRVWSYVRHPEEQGTFDDRIDEAAHTLRRLCAPLLEHVRDSGNPLALNLSGGWDSRALLATLAPLGPERLFTCTYGSATFNGVRIARSLSRSLGIPNRQYDFPNGRHLMDWFTTLCRELPPVVRFNLGDGGYAVSTKYYANVAAATAGHAGGSWTSAPHAPDAAPENPEALGRWVARRWQSSFRRESLRPLLRPDRLDLADAPEDHARQTAREAFAPGMAGAIRWKLEQRIRRLVCVEVRILERRAPLVFLPMMDRPYLDFWGRVPDSELVEQSLYHAALTRRLFVGEARLLGELDREGGGRLGEKVGWPGRVRSMVRQKGLAVGRRLFPAATCAATIADPTAAWWYRDPELRTWAETTLRESDWVGNLFEPDALGRFLHGGMRWNYNLPCIGVWNLLTLAGVERVLQSLPPVSDLRGDSTP